MPPIARQMKAARLTSDALELEAQSCHESLIGRVVNMLRYKAVGFVWCWTDLGLTQFISPSEQLKGIAPGDFLRAHGHWQAYTGNRTGFFCKELVTESIERIARPSGNAATTWRHPASARREFTLLRARFLRARLLGAMLDFLHHDGFSPVISPPIVGSEALHGPTRLFRSFRGEKSGFLTVNALWAHFEQHARGIPAAYQLSTLYWAQDYGNRFSQNEISLLEISKSGASTGELIDLVERLIIKAAKSIALIPTGDGQPATGVSTLDFADLPRVRFDEAVNMAQKNGLLPTGVGHVLPPSLNSMLCERFGRPGCWIIDAPPDATPFYSRVIANADGHSWADSFELRIAAVPNVASGSAWLTHEDMPDARVPPAYQTLFDRNLNHGAAVSIGIDRLAMALLGAQHIRDVVGECRDGRSFLHCGKSEEPPLETLRLTTKTGTAGCPQGVLVEQARALGELEGKLRCKGFLPMTAGLLAAPQLGQNPSIKIDYFGRQAVFRQDFAEAFARMFQAGALCAYRLGPAEPDPNQWWRISPILDLGFVGTDPAEQHYWADWLWRFLDKMPGLRLRAKVSKISTAIFDTPLPPNDGVTYSEEIFQIRSVRHGPGGHEDTPDHTLIRLNLGRLEGLVWGMDRRTEAT